MLNSTHIKLGSNSQTVQFNSPSSGMLQRSHPKSRFIAFDHKSGYWKICYKHADSCRKGNEAPIMKQASIERENSRDAYGNLPVNKITQSNGK